MARRYFDGHGGDVTAYVAGLEAKAKRLAELEAKSAAAVVVSVKKRK